MFRQLQQKLIQQDEQLLKERNRNSPLFIQKKQLQKDIDDFNILTQRQDARAIQQIIERVEHMAMFNRKYHISQVQSSDKPTQSVVISSRRSLSTSCSYRVSLKGKKSQLKMNFVFVQLDFMSRIS